MLKNALYDGSGDASDDLLHLIAAFGRQCGEAA
jgi:hypothetical protein